jgi:hypothetical protein
VLRAKKDHLEARDQDAYENVREGKCRSRVIGALWTKEIFAANREPASERGRQREAQLATLRRAVIAVDPSGCARKEDKRSEEIGIVAEGLRHDGIGACWNPRCDYAFQLPSEYLCGKHSSSTAR